MIQGVVIDQDKLISTYENLRTTACHFTAQQQNAPGLAVLLYRGMASFLRLMEESAAEAAARKLRRP